MSPYTVEFEGRHRPRVDPDRVGCRACGRRGLHSVGVRLRPERALADLRERLEADPKVVATRSERRPTSLHEAHAGERSRVLRADLERVGEVRTLAREIRGVHAREAHAPGAVRLFDVDLAPGFRYCLDRGLDPTPTRDLRTLRLALDEAALADDDVSALEVGGESVDGDATRALRTCQRRLEQRDPDVPS